MEYFNSLSSPSPSHSAITFPPFPGISISLVSFALFINASFVAIVPSSGNHPFKFARISSAGFKLDRTFSEYDTSTYRSYTFGKHITSTRKSSEYPYIVSSSRKTWCVNSGSNVLFSFDAAEKKCPPFLVVFFASSLLFPSFSSSSSVLSTMEKCTHSFASTE